MSDNNSMDKDAYIEQLEKKIIELKKRIEEQVVMNALSKQWSQERNRANVEV